LCVSGIDLAPFYDFSIRFWICSKGMVFFFPILLQNYIRTLIMVERDAGALSCTVKYKTEDKCKHDEFLAIYVKVCKSDLTCLLNVVSSLPVFSVGYVLLTL
jgi:hypothetical protein